MSIAEKGVKQVVLDRPHWKKLGEAMRGAEAIRGKLEVYRGGLSQLA